MTRVSTLVEVQQYYLGKVQSGEATSAEYKGQDAGGRSILTR